MNWYVQDHIEDQAFVGYKQIVQSGAASAQAEAFFGALLQGKTVQEARSQAWSDYSYPKPAHAEDFMAIYGDQWTRLYNVYTGTMFFASGTWYRMENQTP
jgi:hypothetical protein